MKSYGLLLFAGVTVAGGAALAAQAKHDTHAPIEITSDTLNVYQEENKAVFTGHVVAIQEEVRLTSDEMTVYYHRRDEGADAKPGEKPPAKPAPKPAKKPAKPGDPQDPKSAIDRIDAKGHVFLATPTETAKGDNGTYNVVKHEIYMNDNVLLTREKNTLKGDHLVYSFDTGKSTMIGETTEEAQKANPADKSKERVRALFVPDKNTKLAPGKPLPGTNTTTNTTTPTNTTTTTPPPAQ